MSSVQFLWTDFENLQRCVVTLEWPRKVEMHITQTPIKRNIYIFKKSYITYLKLTYVKKYKQKVQGGKVLLSVNVHE